MKVGNTAILLAALLASASSYAAPEQPQREYLYTIQAGDNLSTLSTKLLDSPQRWSEVAKYNKLKNPQLVSPGQVLHMQLAWLKNEPAEAVIETLQGAVKLNGQLAKVGDKVATNANLETPAGASVRMTLPDGSTLNMLQNTQLQAKELGRKPLGEYFSAVFRLVTGRIDAIKKKYPDGQSPLRIQAMHGTIGVRGTHFRMGQEGENTLAEIENGLVSFGNEKSSIPLGAAEGSVADGVHPPAVIQLLAAPTFPVLPETFAPDVISFTMPDMRGAVAYRGEVAKDEGFQELLAPVSSDSAAIHISALQDGQYWMRLRAVDAHGLQGVAAQSVFMVKIPPVVIPPSPPADLPIVQPRAPIMNDTNMLIGWSGIQGYRYELQLAADEGFASLISTTVTPSDYLKLPRTTPGHFFMRMRLMNAASLTGPWSEVVSFDVP